MSTAQIGSLEDAIRHSGEGWLIDWFESSDQALPRLRRVLEKVQERARILLHGNAPDLSEAAIVAEYSRNPQKVRAFFQALGGTRTPDMLLMVWRVLQGMEIKEIRCRYERMREFALDVTLQSPYGEELEVYSSVKIHDFALLRQVGIHEVGEQPVFDGYYAVKVREAR